MLAWLGVMLITGICATFAASRIAFTLPVFTATMTVFVAAMVAGAGFLRAPALASGKRFELLAGVWTLVLYLSLGLAPLGWRLFARH